jgi:L-asparaginase
MSNDISKRRIRIAHLSGSNATIQNTPPLVTSNKARRKYGLPVISRNDGSTGFDVLRPQRLATPAKVYVEQFSAHPLEQDSAHLYGPPDGYIDEQGVFSVERLSSSDLPVYEIELRPEDGLYPMPYMARQTDGRAWDEECAEPMAPDARARQTFLPDGSRAFEEIDRFGIGGDGLGNLISEKADVDFHRILPPAGYRRGLSGHQRADVGDGDIPPEIRGRDFFPYKPHHLIASPPPESLARMVNQIQRILGSGEYDGGIWTQGSPRVEETMYWLNLLLDIRVPICGNAAQRPHGQISNDGPQNIVHSVEYLASRVWADGDGRNAPGLVMIQDHLILAARDVAKVAQRPGGFISTTGQAGVLGSFGQDGPTLFYMPATRHTFNSEVRVTQLPASVNCASMSEGSWKLSRVSIMENGSLLESAIPRVMLVKHGNYGSQDAHPDTGSEVDLLALLDRAAHEGRLAGFISEGLTPNGTVPSLARVQLLRRAVYSGFPVVLVARGNPQEAVRESGAFIGGSNLTATKARMLLMACLMKFGSLPIAKDPAKPTTDEQAATIRAVREYQTTFQTH